MIFDVTVVIVLALFSNRVILSLKVCLFLDILLSHT